MAVTAGTATTVVSTVSYHLTSLRSDTRTSFSVPGSRCSGLVPTMSNPSVPIQAQPPVGQVEAALDVLRGAGYPLPDYALHDSTLEDPAPELYDNSLRFKDPTSLDSRVSLDYLRRDIRSRHPIMSSPLTTLPSKPHSVGISRFFPPEETVNDNLPLSPAISQWLDVQKARAVGVRPSVPSRTLKDLILDSQPFPLVGTYQWTLTHFLRARGIKHSHTPIHKSHGRNTR